MGFIEAINQVSSDCSISASAVVHTRRKQQVLCMNSSRRSSATLSTNPQRRLKHIVMAQKFVSYRCLMINDEGLVAVVQRAWAVVSIHQTGCSALRVKCRLFRKIVETVSRVTYSTAVQPAVGHGEDCRMVEATQ